MVTTTKKELVLVGDNDQVTELTGANLEVFETIRKQIIEEHKAVEIEQMKKQETRKSAYAKLGLTEEEINAIL